MEFWEMWPPEEHERLIENMSAWMDGELPDIASTPEAGGPDDLELEVAEHQACCPSCRDLFEELKELRAGFETLPEPDPPEGFAQGVLDRIREEARPKVIPLFKRPQFRALAGLAACIVMVVGLYNTSRFRHLDKTEKMDVTVRGFSKDAQVADGESPMVNAALADPEPGDAPQITAYAASEAQGMEKAARDSGADGEDALVPPEADAALILDRLPEGAAELIPSDASVSHHVETGVDVYTWLTAEELAAIEALALEQGLISGTSAAEPSPERCALVVRNL